MFACLIGLLVTAGTGALHAQQFPNRPITLVVPFGPGGPSDIMGRMLAEEGSQVLNERIVVINKPGASATLGTAEVFRAKPDGYTTLLADNISTVLQPMRMPLAYTGAADFQPVIKVAVVPNVLVVRGDAKWKSLDEFVADARAHPGMLRVATAGRYTGTDLNMLEFNRIAAIDITTVPASKGSGETVSLLLGGHVEGVVAAAAVVASHVQESKMRALALFTDQRLALLPQVPTTTELGYKTTMRVMLFVSAPRNIDRDALQKLHAALNAAVTSQRFKEFSERNGYQVDPLGPDALGRELGGWQQYLMTLSRQLNIPAAN